MCLPAANENSQWISLVESFFFSVLLSSWTVWRLRSVDSLAFSTLYSKFFVYVRIAASSKECFLFVDKHNFPA